MTLKEIKEVVTKVQGISPKTKNRQTKCNISKYTYHNLARKYTTNNLSSIGKCVSVDHATVLNGIKKLDGLLDAYPKFIPLYNKCEMIVINNSSSKDSPNYEQHKKKFLNKGNDSSKTVYEKLEIRKCERLILNSLSNLSDSDILDFEETRLQPYLRMLKSRRVHNIIEVKGALLLR